MMHSKNKQSGVVLVISLVMLLLLTLIGITGMSTTSLEEKMAGNAKDRNLAFQAAESALRAAEKILDPPNTLPTFSDAGTGGFYTNTTLVDLSDNNLKSPGFWTNNPVALSTVSGLGNNIQPPKYIIQKLSQANTYKITVRATGGSTNSVVILQSIYQTP